MNRFLKCMDVVLKHEGGWVNHPKDPGGETNRGIARLFYPDEDLKGMTKQRAQEIYYRDYWIPMGVGELWVDSDLFIKDPLAVLHIFDMGVNCRNKTQGFKKIIRLAQEIVGTKDDGIMGRITVKAINEKEDFVKLYIQARKDYYKDRTVNNKKLKVFLKGWYWRVDSTVL